jgi:alpha-ribazole phosphatase
MALYLFRHTTPNIAKGTCYGQADIDVTDSFIDEANEVKKYYPNSIDVVFSSPLQRCTKLAAHVTESNNYKADNRLMEINCGDWELKKWDNIPREETEAWMNDFVNEPFKGGENYLALQQRTVNFLLEHFSASKNIAVFTHAGVKRSLLSYIKNIPLINSFNHFNIPYGSITKIDKTPEQEWYYETIYAKPSEEGRHKPSYM